MLKYKLDRMYSRKSVKVPANTSFEWNVVAGRQRPRCTVRGRGRGISRGTPRPKRQRISTGSGSSVAEASTQESCLFDSIPLDSFKTMNIDDKLESIFVYLQDMRLTNQRLLKVEQTVRDLHDHTRVNSRRIDILAYKSIDGEARQRRNNLIFWGIPEFVNEDCMTTLREFFADKLDLDPESISIQRIHRIGRRQQPGRTLANQATQNKHRPLIALFRDYQDVELILSNAGKLRGTRFGINRDYPQEIINARKPLLALKRELKSQNPSSRISIQYPELLNSSITEGEILKCINSLKNNKSSANDRIINEYLKTTANMMLPIYVSYFNLIFDTGIIPDTWLEGIIRPIYKKNGDPLKPENYRPITILSCFGRLFTAVLNQRLYNYLTSYKNFKRKPSWIQGWVLNVRPYFLFICTYRITESKK